MEYPSIPGTSPLSYKVDLPSVKKPLPTTLTEPATPTSASKNIFAFWNLGIHNLPPNLLRNILAWHARYFPLGWNIYVLDTVPGSALNVSRYIDTTLQSVVPEAFTKRTLDGSYAAQHTSDLIRYPLLLKYGGVYMDVGILQFGDIDQFWTNVISNPKSPYDFAGFTMGGFPEVSAVNFSLMATPNNPLIRRANYILLKLWEGKTNTTGMHKHPLVSHIPLMHVSQEVVVDDEGADKMVINDEAMTDYAIQIQCMGAAQRWLDEDDDWNGPKYVREKCWLWSMLDKAFAHEQVTSWSGALQHKLLSQKLPTTGEIENDDQKLARSIVEKTVAESWCLKLGHGFSAKLFGGDTLGMLWKKYPDTDCEEGTYAGWLRWAEVSCAQDRVPDKLDVPVYAPARIGPLME